VQAVRTLWLPEKAVAWLRRRTDLPVPPGTLGGAAAAGLLADLVSGGLDADES
jgi:hypothetical protein